MATAVDPEWLHDRLLAVLKGRTKVPSTHNLLPLAEELTRLKAGAEFWKEERGDLYVAAAGAIAKLNQILPKLREDYQMVLDSAVSWEQEAAESEARAELTKFDAFADAVRNAPVFDPSVPRMDLWKEYAPQLEAAFHKALPDGGKLNGYRFIQAMVPEISGDNSATFDAVRTYLMRRVGQKG